MIRPTRAWRTATVLAAASLVLTACGSDEPTEAGGDDTASASPTAEESKTETAMKGDGTLTIGSLLPQTGDLAYLGPPEFAGVDLAVQEINAAGGVLGKDVEQFDADSGDDAPKIAGGEVNKLLDDNVDVIVGAAASSVSLAVIDKITGARVVHFSPANTAAAFDTYDDKGFYFRTSPSDRLQGQILANLAVEDGFNNVAVMARQDAYGEGLAEQTRTTLEQKGATVPAYELYNAEAQNFTAEINKIAAAKPDALVLISFEEATKIIPSLIAKGIGPQDIQIYFVDGNLADRSGEDYNLAGVKGTLPAPAEVDESFNEKLLEIDPKLKEFSYSTQSYDAVVMSALAATAAKDDAGQAIASELINVSRDGTECTDFAECADLLEQGEDIDYSGASGNIDFNDTGSPDTGTYSINEYEANNKYKQIDSVSGVIN